MSRKKFYITTPIYYPSDKLHIVTPIARWPLMQWRGINECRGAT